MARHARSESDTEVEEAPSSEEAAKAQSKLEVREASVNPGEPTPDDLERTAEEREKWRANQIAQGKLPAEIKEFEPGKGEELLAEYSKMPTGEILTATGRIYPPQTTGAPKKFTVADLPPAPRHAPIPLDRGCVECGKPMAPGQTYVCPDHVRAG